MLGISGDKLKKKMNLICNNIQSVLVLKLQICSNRLDILGDNLSIMQISHLLMPSSWWETPKHHVSTGNYIQLNWTVEEFTEHTQAHISNFSLRFPSCDSMWATFMPICCHHFPLNSRSPPSTMSSYDSEFHNKLRSCTNVLCHVYCNIYVLL